MQQRERGVASGRAEWSSTLRAHSCAFSLSSIVCNRQIAVSLGGLEPRLSPRVGVARGISRCFLPPAPSPAWSAVDCSLVSWSADRRCGSPALTRALSRAVQGATPPHRQGERTRGVGRGQRDEQASAHTRSANDRLLPRAGSVRQNRFASVAHAIATLWLTQLCTSAPQQLCIPTRRTRCDSRCRPGVTAALRWRRPPRLEHDRRQPHRIVPTQPHPPRAAPPQPSPPARPSLPVRCYPPPTRDHRLPQLRDQQRWCLQCIRPVRRQDRSCYPNDARRLHRLRGH